MAATKAAATGERLIAEGMKSDFRHIWPWQTGLNTQCVKFYTKWLKVVHIMVAFVTVCLFVVFVILIGVEMFPLYFALAQSGDTSQRMRKKLV